MRGEVDRIDSGTPLRQPGSRSSTPEVPRHLQRSSARV